MADAPAFAFYRGEMFQAILLEVMGRWMQGIYLYSGGLAAPASGMDISIDAATSPYGSTSGDASFTIDASNATLARIDLLYIDDEGDFTIQKGANAAVVDPMGNGDWREYVAPYPAHSRASPLPAGVPMYLIHVGAGATEITADDLQSIAAIGISGGSTPVSGEEPSGSGTSLALAHTPAAGSIFLLLKNGVMMREGSGNGFTRVADAITLTTAKVAGDWFAAFYYY